MNRHGTIEQFPDDVLGDNRALALLFKDLAILRPDAPRFASVEEIRWNGPTEAFAAFAECMGDAKLVVRCEAIL